MKLYLAAIYTSNFGDCDNSYARLTEAERKGRDEVENLLESYHYIHKPQYVERLRKDKRRVFLDSGAFSAFTKGINVDLPAYCKYVQANSDIIESVDGNVLASVLDGIGDAQKTYENQIYMEGLGVRALPCFHYGEDERYLEWYIKHYDYITIGGMVPIAKPDLKIWLDKIWDKYLTDSSGRPILKVHGFGLTTIPLMTRYPWYSVDSSSWVQMAANGSILLNSGKVLSVSNGSPSRRQENMHLNTITPPQRAAVIKEIEANGFDMDRMQNNYLARWSYNCMMFARLGKSTTDHPFKAEQQDLLDFA